MRAIFFIKHSLAKVIIVSMLLTLFMAGTALAALPEAIYYESANGKMVKADYEAAIENVTEGDLAMLLAIKNALKAAQDNFREIVVVTTDNKIIDWAKALDDGLSFTASQTNSNYWLVVPPVPVLFTQYDGTEGAQDPGTGDIAQEDFIVERIY